MATLVAVSRIAKSSYGLAPASRDEPVPAGCGVTDEATGLIAQDSECSPAAMQIGDADCGKLSTSSLPKYWYEDNDCVSGEIGPEVEDGRDADCGKVYEPAKLWADNDCGVPTELYKSQDQDCGKYESSPTSFHDDSDCANSTGPRNYSTDNDCAKTGHTDSDCNLITQNQGQMVAHNDGDDGTHTI